MGTSAFVLSSLQCHFRLHAATPCTAPDHSSADTTVREYLGRRTITLKAIIVFRFHSVAKVVATTAR